MFRTRASCTIHPMNKRLRGPLRYLEATFQATLIVANKEERKTEKGNEYSTLRHCPSICPRRFLYLSYLTYFFSFKFFILSRTTTSLFLFADIPDGRCFLQFPEGNVSSGGSSKYFDRNNILCENSFFVILVKKQVLSRLCPSIEEMANFTTMFLT